jgi:NADH:ubiquinone oxidoreductase subunit F (NADH-binding)
MSVVSWGARRRIDGPLPAENLVEELRHATPGYSAFLRGLPMATVSGVHSFYDYLRHPARRRVCTGTACRFASDYAPPSPDLGAEVHCLGRCYQAPCRTGDHATAIPRRALLDEPVVLRNLLAARPGLVSDLYTALTGDEILAEVASSGLRGRGGAAYPTAAKWSVARTTPAPRKFVVANGDEGDPGSFVDRLILEEDPHAVLAGMAACARVIGADHGIVYVRGEYPAAASRVREAIADAVTAGLLGRFTVEVHVGAGSYVCGEETALLRSIEGQRGEAQPRPPYPAERGLHGCPTVVQNVETLSVIPWLLASGRRPDSKAFSLSGAVARPGVVEARFGITLADLLERGGGGSPEGRRWRMALVGGPMGRVIPAERFGETRLGYDTLPGMGHGGVVVLDESVTARALAEHLFAFAASESCGSCAPCRLGTAQLGSRRDRVALERLLDTLEIGSMCGFGQGVPRPIRDLLAAYADETFAEAAP